MPANIQAQAGEGQITMFEIESNYGKPVDVSQGVIELTYYESILDCTVRASATFVDSGYRKSASSVSVIEKDDVNLNVGEKINLKMKDGNNFELKFTGNNKLRVLETRNVDESVNKVIYTIDMTSLEYHDNDNLETAVTKRYDGKIHDNVKNILSSVLKTKKKIDCDNVLNDFNFTGKSQKPFYICTWLAKRSVPDTKSAKGILAGFLFFENYDGFKFKSIDKLFEGKPEKKFIFSNSAGPIPKGYNAKILAYSFDSTHNLKKIRLSGAMGQTEIRTFDPYSNKYEQTSFNSKQQFQVKNTGGTERIKIGDDQEKTTRRFVKVKDTAVLPKGNELKEQLKNSKNKLNFNIDEILRQSSMRYNGLYAIKLSVTIPGDMSLRAGDLIHCDFPEVSAKDNKTYSNKKSGIYMIADVAHRISKNSCYTQLNLVRESIGRKPF